MVYFKSKKMLDSNQESSALEEHTESIPLKNFNRCIKMIFSLVDDVDLKPEDSDADSHKFLLSSTQLKDMCHEASILNKFGGMKSIAIDHLIITLKVLEKNVINGVDVSPFSDEKHGRQERRQWLEHVTESILRALYASLSSLYIMMSPDMPKRIVSEDYFDTILLFAKYQLQNTIFPYFDSSYVLNDDFDEIEEEIVILRKKLISTLYSKLCELVNLLTEVVVNHTLTDTSVICATSLSLLAFSAGRVEDLQRSSLKLITMIFSKYEKHQNMIMDDIMSLICNSHEMKNSSRTYRLNNGEYVQMSTVLVVQAVQFVIVFYDELPGFEKNSSKKFENFIISKYGSAKNVSTYFLSNFLRKCGIRNGSFNMRAVFEKFVDDLLIMVNKPEWPVADMFLNVLMALEVKNFTNKSIDLSLRTLSLESFGMIVSRLRKDALTLQSKFGSIHQIIKDVKKEDQNECGQTENVKVDVNSEEFHLEEVDVYLMQKILLDILSSYGQNDLVAFYAGHFRIAEWYNDTLNMMFKLETESNVSPGKLKIPPEIKSEVNRKGEPTENDKENREESEMSRKSLDEYIVLEERKEKLINLIRQREISITNEIKTWLLPTYIDYETAELICCYFSMKRSFSKNFEMFIKQILCTLTENCIAIRSKALKSLAIIVEVDPAILSYHFIQLGVNHSFMDSSAVVREAAVDLIGKFILRCPDLVDKYYEMVLIRISDSNVSVRKRVIRILSQICMMYPETPKYSEICVKIIRRVKDEEGVKKLVLEVFQNLWLMPIQENPQVGSKAMEKKVKNLINFIANCNEEVEDFEYFLLHFFQPNEAQIKGKRLNTEPSKDHVTACQQLVDCLLENALKFEEISSGLKEKQMTEVAETEHLNSCQHTSKNMAACFKTLYLFAKVQPHILVPHAPTLLPYLSIKCQTVGDTKIIVNVAKILELVVPLMEHPSDLFLAQLEEDCMKIIITEKKILVDGCLSCLSSVINNVTHNSKLIKDCMEKYYCHLTKLKSALEKEDLDSRLAKYRGFFCRALFTIGLIFKYFDFPRDEAKTDFSNNIQGKVFEILIYFVKQTNGDTQIHALQALGFLCIKNYEFMLRENLKNIYIQFLKNQNSPLEIKIQTLKNFQIYLQEEELLILKNDAEWRKRSKQENLKEMKDVLSGMASTVIQLYLKEILESYLHPSITVRMAVANIIHLILRQGLVYPSRLVASLICMSTDLALSRSAEKELLEIELKYPGLIHMKCQEGMHLSYELQKIIQNNAVVRGYRFLEQGPPVSHFSILYSILRKNRKQRRCMILSVLQQIDDQTNDSLSKKLYFADNLAHLKFHILDEPLFIIYHIDVMVAVSGSNLLQDFEEAFSSKGVHDGSLDSSMDTNRKNDLIDNVPENHDMPVQNDIKSENILKENCDTDDSSAVIDIDSSVCDEDESVLLTRISENISALKDFVMASRACMLLLILKEHLKTISGISDLKLINYSPAECNKMYDKALNRRKIINFDPKEVIFSINEESTSENSDENTRAYLVQQYLNFKELMMKFDSNEDSDEDWEGYRKEIFKSVKISQTITIPNTPSTKKDDSFLSEEVRRPKRKSFSSVVRTPEKVARLNRRSNVRKVRFQLSSSDSED